jgi:hypothetical protein
MVNWSLRYGKKTLPKDYFVTWETKPLFVDIWEAPVVEDAAREYPTMLAQGMKNGEHTLTLSPKEKGKLNVKAFRIYRPLVEASK